MRSSSERVAPNAELALEILVDVKIGRQLEAVVDGALGVTHAVEHEGADFLAPGVKADAIDRVAVQHERVGVNRNALFVGARRALVKQRKRAQIGDGLKNTVIVIVQQAEPGQSEQPIENSAVTMDNIVIVFVGINILVKKSLSEQAVDNTRHVAAGFFRDVGEDGFGIEGHDLFHYPSCVRERVACFVFR